LTAPATPAAASASLGHRGPRGDGDLRPNAQFNGAVTRLRLTLSRISRLSINFDSELVV